MNTSWKRFLALALCCVILCGLLPGCGILNDPDDTTQNTAPNDTNAADGTNGTDGSDPTKNPDSATDPNETTKPSAGSDPTAPSDVTDPTETTGGSDPVPTDPTTYPTPTDPATPTQPTPTDPPEKPLPPSADQIIDVGSEALPYTQQEIYDQLFNMDNKIEINIDMSDAELQKMQNDHDTYSGRGSKSPIFRLANVSITIITATDRYTYRIPEVGVRMKGNTSRTSFYNEQDGIYKYIHLKLDFQETFDDKTYYGSSAKVWSDKNARDARKDRTFATLEKLDLRWNKCYDATYLKESYAYALYRSEGVLAPLTNLSSLDWSGVHMGVYTVNEPVDKIFLEKRLPEADQDGDLYKCSWPASFTNTGSIGVEDEDKGQFYTYDLKNNKKTSKHEALKNLITQLNAGGMTKEKFAKLVDVDNFLHYAAVSYFLGNPDDLRNNYNNFYLYFLPSSGKAIIIPYDYDRCLGVTYEWDPTGNGVTQDDPFSDTIAAGSNNGGDSKQKNPLFYYSVVKGGFYVKEYAEVLKEVAGNSLLKASTFASWFNRAKNLYSGDTAPNKELKNASGRQFQFSLADGIAGNLSFQNYISKKMATYTKCIGKVDEYLDYERPEPTNFYVRGTFCDWNIRDDYAMEMVDGKAVFRFSFSHDFKFKVYSQSQDKWWGSESVSEDTTVSYQSSGRTNVWLQRGSYLVTFDPETQLITIVPG